MDVSTALVAHPQAAELAQPAQGALHHPAVDAQPAAVFRPATGQRWRDVARSQRLAMSLGIIGSIPIQTRRPTTGTAAAAAHRRHAIHQRQQLGYVMAVGTCQSC